MKIDLNTCKPGQKLLTNNNEIAFYRRKTGSKPYAHLVQIGEYDYGMTDDGFYFEDKRESKANIKEILSAPIPLNIFIRNEVGNIFNLYKNSNEYQWVKLGNEYCYDEGCIVNHTSLTEAIYNVLHDGVKLVRPVQKTVTEYIPV